MAACRTSPSRACSACRTVLPPAVPGIPGCFSSPTPDVAEGQPRHEVRRRVPARQPNYIDLRSLNGELSFTTDATRASLRRFLLGLARRSGDAVPRADLYANGGSSTRKDSWRARFEPDHHGRRPLRNVHALLDRNNLLTNIDRPPPDLHGERRQHFRPGADSSRCDDIAPRVGVTWSASDRVVIRGGLRHLLSAVRPLRQREPAWAEPAAAGGRVDLRQQCCLRSGLHVYPGLQPLNPATVNPSIRAMAHPGPEPDTPIVPPIRFGPEFQFAEHGGRGGIRGNRTRNGRRLRTSTKAHQRQTP